MACGYSQYKCRPHALSGETNGLTKGSSFAVFGGLGKGYGIDNSAGDGAGEHAY